MLSEQLEVLKRLEEQIALKEKQNQSQKENKVELAVEVKVPTPKINIFAKKSFDEKDGGDS
jgi:hypothetical protein